MSAPDLGNMTHYTVQRIAEHVLGEVIGAGDETIWGVNQIDHAVDGQLTFVASDSFAKRWASSNATAGLVGKDIDLEPGKGRALIRVADADLAMAKVLELFAPALPAPPAGVHDTAVVDPTATLASDVSVGAHVYIGPRSVIGQQSIIHPNVSILDDVTLGAHCVLWPGVVIRERCKLGDRCVLHPNVTIGGDGFGYRRAPDGSGVVKIPQIGTVALGCDVEIGAGTCVDRGKFAATTIGDGTKIDNLCQIAHNCCIGQGCLLAGKVGLAGSVTLGDGVVMGGKASVRDHVTIGDGAMIAALAAVAKDMPAGAKWAGIPAGDVRASIKRHFALAKLPELIKRLQQIEKQYEGLVQSDSKRPSDSDRRDGSRL